jgi:hypothetical protein
MLADNVLFKLLQQKGNSFQGRFSRIQEFKNWAFFGVSSFLFLGGFLSSRGITVEKMVVEADM